MIRTFVPGNESIPLSHGLRKRRRFGTVRVLRRLEGAERRHAVFVEVADGISSPLRRYRGIARKRKIFYTAVRKRAAIVAPALERLVCAVGQPIGPLEVHRRARTGKGVHIRNGIAG